MQAAFGTSFSGVRIHNGADAATLAAQHSARALTFGQHVAFGAGQYQPGTRAGDALLAHELAHTVQQRGQTAPSPTAAGHARLESEADHAALHAIAGEPAELQAGSAGGLRLQRCEFAATPDNLDSLSAEEKATAVRALIREDELGMEDAVVAVFAAGALQGQFVQMQRALDMDAVFGGVDDWTTVRIAALGPVVEGTRALTRARRDYIVEATQDYGPAYAQVFVAFIFDTTQDDQIIEVIQWLAGANRLDATLGRMPAIEARLRARGIELGDYQDRASTVGDFFRGVGEGLSGMMNTSEAARGAIGNRMAAQTLDMPAPYREARDAVTRALLEEAMTPSNIALGALDQATFGIPSGLYGLVASTGAGIWSLFEGDLDDAGRELVPALVLLVTLGATRGLGARGGGGGTGAPRGGGGGRVRFRTPAVGGAITAEQAIAQLPTALRNGATALLQRFSDAEINRAAGYARRSSGAAAVIEQHGPNGVRGLLGSGGDPAAARALIATWAAGAAGGSTLPEGPAPQALPETETETDTDTDTDTEDGEDEEDSSAKPLRWDPGVTVTRAAMRGGLTFREGTSASVSLPGVGTFASGAGSIHWQAHHTWPMQYGGKDDQSLMGVLSVIHNPLLHNALHAYLTGLGHDLSRHTTDNGAFITRLQDEPDFALQVKTELKAFYALVNTQTEPQIPRSAYSAGIDDSY